MTDHPDDGAEGVHEDADLTGDPVDTWDVDAPHATPDDSEPPA